MGVSVMRLQYGGYGIEVSVLRLQFVLRGENVLQVCRARFVIYL